MTQNTNSPLSIRQFMYDPITSWQKFFNPQITLNYKPTTNEIEGHVVERAGSYGKQLGIILDVISVLKNEIITEKSELTAEQKEVLCKFDHLASSVKSAVRTFKGQAVDDGGEQLASRLDKVKQNDPKVYRECMAKLDKSLANNN